MFNLEEPEFKPEYKDYQEYYLKMNNVQQKILEILSNKYLRGEEIKGLIEEFNKKSPYSKPLSMALINYIIYLKKKIEYEDRKKN